MTSPLPRLGLESLDRASPALERLAYSPRAAKIGVMHFGPGAFHRAHQAYIFHRLLSKDLRWGVSGVSLRSSDLQVALDPQDGLYVLAQRDQQERFLTIGSLRERLTAPLARQLVIQRLLSPDLRLVTSTITEKGYCLSSSGDLDTEHQDIRADLANWEAPSTFIGWLYLGLKLRRAAGMAPFLTAPCDNLSDNGGKLARAVASYADRLDRDMADWLRGERPFVSTMVDSITPATDDALRAMVADACGVYDAWPVQREAFVQWVIEQDGRLGDADWQDAGVQITTDIAAFERAKLRLLNGAHSLLAYLGLGAGVETVAEACNSTPLALAVERLWDEVQPLLAPASGLDLVKYRPALMGRFRNPVIIHKLSQIAWDGSQKVPVRLMTSFVEALARGLPTEMIALAIAGWMRFCVAAARSGREMIDTLAADLQRLGQAASDLPADADAFLDAPGIFNDSARTPLARAKLRDAYQALVVWGEFGAIERTLRAID